MDAPSGDDEIRDRIRASLTPWHRSAAYVGAMAVGIGLWLLGTADGSPAAWTRNLAWVPFVTAALLVLRRQRRR